MKTTLEKLEGNQIALEVEVDEKRVEEAIERVFRKVAQQIRVPGFRAGRAPRRVVENRVGKDYLRWEALDALIPEVYAEAIRENNLRPIDAPPVDILENEEGKPVRFRAVVEVEPEVTLGDYKGLKATKQIAVISNAHVNEALENMREQGAQLVTVERDEVRTGDFAVMDFTGYVDDQPFPGGAAQGHTLEIGSGQFIPGFEEQLVGANTGETAQVHVTFPEDYGAPDLAGKEARFDVVIHEIKEKKLPALNDDFAKDMGEFETLLELRADIRKNLEEEVERRATQSLEADVLQALVDRSEVDIPQKMVDFQIDYQIRQAQEELEMRGLDKERYLEFFGFATEEELREELQEDAKNEVKTSLVMDAFIKELEITVSDEELDERITEMAGEGARADAVKGFWETQKERLSSILAREKALEILVENGDIDEIQVEEPEETEADQGQEDSGQVDAD
ncbi:MAG: trigger factor [Firmicutes bacterium]|nr:trigger factor [Bacillota bacterium]